MGGRRRVLGERGVTRGIGHGWTIGYQTVKIFLNLVDSLGSETEKHGDCLSQRDAAGKQPKLSDNKGTLSHAWQRQVRN
jgi:hypothetical protein